MQKSQLIIAFLLGVVVAMGVALVNQSGGVVPQAHAQAAADGTQMFAVTGTGTSGQGKDILFLVDPQAPRIAVYEYNNGRLELGAMRNIEYELRFEEWSPRGREQRPPVREMRQASEENAEGGEDRRRR